MQSRWGRGLSIVGLNIMGNSAARKSDIVNIVILAAFASCIGAYLVATAVLIAEDGVRYVEEARSFSVDPAQGVQRPPIPQIWSSIVVINTNGNPCEQRCEQGYKSRACLMSMYLLLVSI